MNFTLLDGIREILGHMEYVNSLGWIFAMSMMVGAILNDGGKKLVTWTIAILVAVSLTETTRFVYWSAHNLPGLAIQGSAITLVSTLVDVFGLAVGWFLAYSARQKARGKSLFPIREEHNRRKSDDISVVNQVNQVKERQ